MPRKKKSTGIFPAADVRWQDKNDQWTLSAEAWSEISSGKYAIVHRTSPDGRMQIGFAKDPIDDIEKTIDNHLDRLDELGFLWTEDAIKEDSLEPCFRIIFHGYGYGAELHQGQLAARIAEQADEHLRAVTYLFNLQDRAKEFQQEISMDDEQKKIFERLLFEARLAGFHSGRAAAFDTKVIANRKEGGLLKGPKEKATDEQIARVLERNPNKPKTLIAKKLGYKSAQSIRKRIKKMKKNE